MWTRNLRITNSAPWTPGHAASVWKNLKLFSTYQDTRARLNITKVATMLSSKNKLQITTNAMLRISNISVKTYKNKGKAIKIKPCFCSVGGEYGLYNSKPSSFFCLISQSSTWRVDFSRCVTTTTIRYLLLPFEWLISPLVGVPLILVPVFKTDHWDLKRISRSDIVIVEAKSFISCSLLRPLETDWMRYI